MNSVLSRLLSFLFLLFVPFVAFVAFPFPSLCPFVPLFPFVPFPFSFLFLAWYHSVHASVTVVLARMDANQHEV